MSLIFKATSTLFKGQSQQTPQGPNLIKYPLFVTGYSSTPLGSDDNWKWMLTGVGGSVAEGVLSHSSSGKFTRSFIQNPAPNKSYRAIVTMSGIGCIFTIREYNSASATLNSVQTKEYTVTYPANSIDFTTQATTVKIALSCSSTAVGTFTFKDPYVCEL